MSDQPHNDPLSSIRGTLLHRTMVQELKKMHDSLGFVIEHIESVDENPEALQAEALRFFSHWQAAGEACIAAGVAGTGDDQ